MKKTIFLACLFFLAAVISCYAQFACKPGITAGHLLSGAKTTVADPAEDNYDVKYVKLNLHLFDTSIYIAGDVTTKAVTVASSFSSYVFELDSTMTIDSILFDGSPATFTTIGDVRHVALPSPLSAGTPFTAQVFYHGTPVSGGGFFGISSFSMSGTNGVVTLSECYHAKEWWPCKQSLRDKIDSTDTWLTVPERDKAGSNGLLQATVPAGPGLVRYEWKERYPIDYYLVSYAVASYAEYSYYMHFTGTTDSMLIQNYVYNDPAYLPTIQANLDSVGSVINYLSGLYGRYPFWKEKYGHSESGFSGGMENQTMTTTGGLNDMDIVSHELGHQWFGDNVTCGSWADIIMNEGFATYTSYLYESHFNGPAAGTSFMSSTQTSAKFYSSGACFVDDTTNELRVFDGVLTYSKGGAILHILRSIINNDLLFFQVFQNYQSAHAGGNGAIDDFKSTAEALLGVTTNGISLDTFFNQWAYLQGYPHFSINWNQIGTDVYVDVKQYGTDVYSVPYFTLPLELQLRSPSGDTLVRVNIYQPEQTYHFSWSNTIDSVSFDPNGWLIYVLDSNVNDPQLGVGVPQITSGSFHIAPNPATTCWQVSGMAANRTLTLTDMAGHIVWQAEKIQEASISIPAGSLPEGLYFLSVRNGQQSQVFKLSKL